MKRLARPCRRTRTKQRGECRRDYSSIHGDLVGWQSRHAGPASGRIAQSLPPCRTGPDFPGECRAALQHATVACINRVVAGSNPAVPVRVRSSARQSTRHRVAKPLSPGPGWRSAQLPGQRVLVPMVEGSNPSPPAMNTPGNAGQTTESTARRLPGPLSRVPYPPPGECRAALQPSTLVVAGSTPAVPTKLVGAQLRWTEQECVAEPLSPGP